MAAPSAAAGSARRFHKSDKDKPAGESFELVLNIDRESYHSLSLIRWLLRVDLLFYCAPIIYS